MMRCCANCARHSSVTTSSDCGTAYCCAHRQYVNLLFCCHLYFPMSGYEEVKEL